MDIELEDTSDILDLTKPKVTTDTNPATEETTDNVDVATEVTNDGEAEVESTENEDENTEESSQYFVGDLEVQVEVPEEVSGALDELGIDSKSMLSHLFKKGGDFTLPEADKEKLDAKYGKFVVDTMLSNYKAQNQSFIDSHTAGAKEAEAKLAANGEQYVKAVGGEEGLVAMEAYLLESLDDEQIGLYNELMQSDDHKSQILLITQIKKQMELADKLKNGDTNFSLVGDNTAEESVTSPSSKGYLTAEEYQNEIKVGSKYWTDKAYAKKIDAARTAGLVRNK